MGLALRYAPEQHLSSQHVFLAPPMPYRSPFIVSGSDPLSAFMRIQVLGHADFSDVAGVNFVPYLWRLLREHRRASAVVRLDIEGEEYNVLPALAVSGLGPWLAQHGRRLVVVVEWTTGTTYRTIQ